jgi:hypothetical protein
VGIVTLSATAVIISVSMAISESAMRASIMRIPFQTALPELLA